LEELDHSDNMDQDDELIDAFGENGVQLPPRFPPYKDNCTCSSLLAQRGQFALEEK